MSGAPPAPSTPPKTDAARTPRKPRALHGSLGPTGKPRAAGAGSPGGGRRGARPPAGGTRGSAARRSGRAGTRRPPPGRRPAPRAAGPTGAPTCARAACAWRSGSSCRPSSGWGGRPGWAGCRSSAKWWPPGRGRHTRRRAGSPRGPGTARRSAASRAPWAARAGAAAGCAGSGPPWTGPCGSGCCSRPGGRTCPAAPPRCLGLPGQRASGPKADARGPGRLRWPSGPGGHAPDQLSWEPSRPWQQLPSRVLERGHTHSRVTFHQGELVSHQHPPTHTSRESWPSCLNPQSPVVLPWTLKTMKLKKMSFIHVMSCPGSLTWNKPMDVTTSFYSESIRGVIPEGSPWLHPTGPEGWRDVWTAIPPTPSS